MKYMVGIHFQWKFKARVKGSDPQLSFARERHMDDLHPSICKSRKYFFFPS